VREVLRWIDAWKALPLSALEANPAVAPAVLELRKRRWLHVFDSAVGPMVSLNREGMRRVGSPPSQSLGLRGSIRGASLRGLLYLAALEMASKGVEVEVVGFTRHHLRVLVFGRPGLLGLHSGDYQATLRGGGRGFPVSLPRQFRVSEHDIEDLSWWRWFDRVLPPPAVPFRGAYWGRTLLDGYRAWVALGRQAVVRHGEGFYRAVRHFAEKRGPYLPDELKRGRP